MESQGKNEEAAAVYDKSLEDNPKTLVLGVCGIFG
jgi:hypothetical protein